MWRGLSAARYAVAIPAAGAALRMVTPPSEPRHFAACPPAGLHCETKKPIGINVGNSLKKAIGTKRVVVTGGSGFLGSHLCRRLLAEGHEVICVDNFFTSQKTNVADLVPHPNFELVQHDITEPFTCECDWIFNMACPASPPHYQYNPVKTMKVCILGTMNMLGLAKRVKARILQASTSEVYGDPEISPQPEEYWGKVNCNGVRSCYDEGKRAAETLCFDYIRSNNVDVRVARIFNTYGPGMHPYDGRVVTNFIMQALNGEDITVYGDGSQTRSFCFVEDLIEGLLRHMTQDETPGPINIGNPVEFTMLELAKLVIEITGSKSKIVHLPLPGDDPKQRRPDITRAKQYLDDWEPKVQLREGLERTIDYFRHLDLDKFKKPTPHTAHASSQGELQTWNWMPTGEEHTKRSAALMANKS